MGEKRVSNTCPISFLAIKLEGTEGKEHVAPG